MVVLVVADDVGNAGDSCCSVARLLLIAAHWLVIIIRKAFSVFTQSSLLMMVKAFMLLSQKLFSLGGIQTYNLLCSCVLGKRK